MLELRRRDFLRKIGATSLGSLALGPLVLASRANAETGTKPRLLLIKLAHGLAGRGMASGTEHNFTFAPWFTPLNAIKEHVTLVDGVFGTWWGNAHNVSNAHMLTGSVKPYSENFPKARAASLDVLLENHLGRGILPVQRLAVGKPFTSITSNKSICWNTKSEPLPFSNPFSINNTLLNNIGKSSSQSAEYLNFSRKTLLDEAIKDIKALKGRINAAEQRKLEYQLNEISNATASLGLGDGVKVGGQCQKPTLFDQNLAKQLRKKPSAEQYEKCVNQQFEHVRLMFACHLTQIAVMTITQVDVRAYEWIDTKGNKRVGQPCPGSDFHQCVAHHSGDPEARLCYEGSVRYVVQKLTNFAKQLDQIVEPNGKTMLENTMIVVGGEIGDGTHDRNRKPVLIIGGRGAPGLKTGRYISIPEQQGWSIKTPDGDIKTPRKISTRTEADLLREVGMAMGYKTQTIGSPYLNRGTIGLM